MKTQKWAFCPVAHMPRKISGFILESGSVSGSDHEFCLSTKTHAGKQQMVPQVVGCGSPSAGGLCSTWVVFLVPSCRPCPVLIIAGLGGISQWKWIEYLCICLAVFLCFSVLQINKNKCKNHKINVLGGELAELSERWSKESFSGDNSTVRNYSRKG